MQVSGEYLDALGTAMWMATELSVANIFPSFRLLQNLSTALRRAMACRDWLAHIIGQPLPSVLAMLWRMKKRV